MASTGSSQETSMQLDCGEMYKITGRTMKVEEDDLTVEVENPMDFISLTHHQCDLTSYLKYKDLNGYFNMLNGPTYENLVKYF